MQTADVLPDSRHPDMSPEAIDQRLRELAQIYKLGMSLRDARWLGPADPRGGPDEVASDPSGAALPEEVLTGGRSQANSSGAKAHS